MRICYIDTSLVVILMIQNLSGSYFGANSYPKGAEYSQLNFHGDAAVSPNVANDLYFLAVL